MSPAETEILVLGAGLLGTGVALELARRGVPVTLLDQDPRPLNRASLRNEGKVHLGFIYANDRSLGSAFLQLEGALRFRATVAGWLPRDADWLVPSTPFHYLVAADSVVAAERLAEHYAAVEARCLERLGQDPALDYLGARPRGLVRPLEHGEIAAHFDAARFAAGFATAERALDTDRLAESLRQAVADSPAVEFLPSRLVRSVAEVPGGFRVEGDGPAGTWSLRARQVVNATWERRLALDRQVGLAPPEQLLHRLKYRVICRLPAELRGAPSVTMVLGRYGDVVVRGDGTAFLSWYPAGLRGWSDEVEPPREWDAACRGEAEPGQAREIAAAIMAGIDAWYPGVGRAEPLQVDAGAIVAIGRTDVDDPASALHDRSRIGVTSRGGWHSVDPGKLTTAPLFAREAADRVEALRSASPPRVTAAAVRPKVVALVPTWNAEGFIAGTLDALAVQTWPNLEILVADDASPDGTVGICERYAARDGRFRVLRRARNLGWTGNVNALLREARGDYLFFAFHDDLPAPDYIERCVAALEANPRAVIAYSDLSLVNRDGSREERVYDALDGVTSRLERGRIVARRQGAWWVPNRGVFRSAAAEAIGGLRRNLAGEFSADWPWLLHMSLLGEAVRIPERLDTKIYQEQSLSREWRYGLGHWAAVMLSASAVAWRAEIGLRERLVLQATLVATFARQVRDVAGRWLRGAGVLPAPPDRQARE
jgi:glycine/D-amino acid oxidase-like deaminating enzyme